MPKTASPTATATSGAQMPGDLDGDGEVTAADAALLVAEIYDGDGDTVSEAAAGAVASAAAADLNGDGHISAADLSALTALRSE
jgi:hypothetical protein